MPVKQRVAKERRPSFSAEAVALFAELECSPDGWRPYTDESYRLAVMLGLVNEWWASYHVNDPASRPTHSPGYVAYDAFWRTREVRAALLAASGLEGDSGTIVPKSPTESTAEPPAVSGLPPKAAAERTSVDVSKVPLPDVLPADVPALS